MGKLDRALAAAVIGDVALGKATIRQPVFGFEFVQYCSQFFAICAAILELVREFMAAVFTPRQQA
jgi:hypothetical protein